MLLHKKRIRGNLNGVGYVNPYTNGLISPHYMQPTKYNDYERNLILKTTDFYNKQIEQEKAEYNNFLKNKGLKEEIMEESDIKVDPKLKQSGSGLEDVMNIASQANQMYNIIRTGGKAALKAYSGPTGTKVKNLYSKYINPNPNHRPSYVGEKHLIHSSGNTFNFLGPGTQIKKRMARGDLALDGRFGLDKPARKHDIAYLNAKSLKQVRKADIQFIKDIDKAQVNPISKNIVKLGMKAKMKAEDLGILDPNHFSNIDIAENKDTQIVGSGFTKKRKLGKYPDSNLRSKILKNYKKSRIKLKNKVSV